MVAASAVVGVVASVGMPAAAEPDYPSWADIQQAKQSEASKQAEISKLGEILTGLQAAADAAAQTAGIAGEAFRNATVELESAKQREAELASQVAAAEAAAQQSKIRAGLIAASIARQGGGDLTLDLLLNANDAEDLLRQLSAASKVGQSAAEVYRQAIMDQRTSQTLADQAGAASQERERLASEAQAASDAAQDAAAAADAAYAEQAAHADQLYAQLAALKDTTAELERERANGVAAEQAAAVAAALAAASSASAGSNAQSSASPTSSAPASGAVEAAIAFASEQIGDSYGLGGVGPDVWDCSGLTLMAYRAAGISIGSHSATNQYRTLADRGLAVDLSDIQRGDLLFWGGGGSYYHVAIYLGGGRILEAPDYGKPVRNYYIWGSPSAAARPAG